MTPAKPAPVLSVLIPAYNYAAGIDRILSRSGKLSGRVEYIVHDDSTDDAVAAAVAGHDGKNVIYRRNAGQGNAVANWNSLLERASGDYVILVHHDEFPCRTGLFEDLAEHLDAAGPANGQVFLLGLRRLRRKWPVTDKLIPDYIRSWLLLNFPHYLARRNFVGPSATFVVRRTLCPRFDESLRWLVDVDFYLNALQRSGVRGLSKFCIVSEVDRRQSITRSLGGDLAALHVRELAIVAARHPGNPLRKPALPAILERALWLGARLAGACCLGPRYGG
jgi:glycosyltransferase involved in cell wall biosynthesis